MLKLVMLAVAAIGVTISSVRDIPTTDKTVRMPDRFRCVILMGPWDPDNPYSECGELDTRIHRNIPDCRPYWVGEDFHLLGLGADWHCVQQDDPPVVYRHSDGEPIYLHDDSGDDDEPVDR
jgi:hypothetical protein